MHPPQGTPERLARWRAWLEMSAGVALATAVGWGLEADDSLISQAMLYVLVVVVLAYRSEWVVSVTAAVAAVAALNFFFVPPRWTFAVDSPQHLLALAAMLVVALVISGLSAALRRRSAWAHLNATRAQQLQALAAALAPLETAAAVCAAGQAALATAFGPLVALALAEGLDDADVQPAPDAALTRDGMRQCLRDNAVLGPGTGRWPGLDAWWVPLAAGALRFGAICVRPAAANDSAGRAHAVALATQISQALLRLHLNAAASAARGEALRQQWQSTFLAAISHDLRTPVAAIVAAASALQTQHERLAPEQRQRLLDTLVQRSGHLVTVMENTLQLVRLSDAASTLQRDWQSLEEIVGAAMAQLRGRDDGGRVHSRVAPGLPLVQADPVLLGQLLTNLLDNALKYSSGAVDLVVRPTATGVELAVKDRGAGIAPHLAATLFQPFQRGDRSAAGGVGLGLAVCQAIARAHGAELAVRKRAGGGAVFFVVLPQLPQQPQAPEAAGALP